jgi:hypothetical protein
MYLKFKQRVKRFGRLGNLSFLRERYFLGVMELFEAEASIGV